MNPKMIEIAEKKIDWKNGNIFMIIIQNKECPPDCLCRSSTFDDEPNFFLWKWFLKITRIFKVLSNLLSFTSPAVLM
jgi:hypothetical protein